MARAAIWVSYYSGGKDSAYDGGRGSGAGYYYGGKGGAYDGGRGTSGKGSDMGYYIGGKDSAYDGGKGRDYDGDEPQPKKRPCKRYGYYEREGDDHYYHSGGKGDDYYQSGGKHDDYYHSGGKHGGKHDSSSYCGKRGRYYDNSQNDVGYHDSGHDGDKGSDRKSYCDGGKGSGHKGYYDGGKGSGHKGGDDDYYVPRPRGGKHIRLAKGLAVEELVEGSDGYDYQQMKYIEWNKRPHAHVWREAQRAWRDASLS